MKKRFSLFMLLFFSLQLVIAFPESGIQPKSEEKTEVKETKTLRKEQRKERRMQRFQEKWDKLMSKMEKKKADRIEKAESTTDVWDDGRFRLGVILLAAALALGIVSLIISLAGLINFIAGLLALGGVVLIVWSLVEYYA